MKVQTISVLVTGIQAAQVLELKESFDPTDVGSLDPRHKGEDDGELGADLARQSISVSVSSLSHPVPLSRSQSFAYGMMRWARISRNTEKNISSVCT